LFAVFRGTWIPPATIVRGTALNPKPEGDPTMRKVLTLTIMAIAIMVAAQLTAQQPPQVKPGPEHAMLKECEGTWDATVKSKGSESKGMLHCKMDLNGLWLLEHFTGEFDGKTFEGRGAMSYDPGKKKFVSVWIDSMATSPMLSEGTFDKGTMTMTMTGMMPTPDGKSMKATLTTVYKDTNNKTFSLKGTLPDGKELEMVHITYKRRAK
jgi:hypothetical protein